MAVLTNKSIASTYKSVLSIGATTESALTSSIQQLTDGLGNGSPLSMSTTQIQFNAGSNTFKFPTTRGTSGQILKLSDANGTLDWVADASGDVTKTDPIALNTIAVWNDNVDELRSDTTMSINASHNISLLQTNSVPTDVSSYNIGGGNIANVTGSRNVGFGKQNLNAVLTGSDNTAMGNGSLEKVTSGNSNTGFGSDALGNSTDGDFNTAVGSGALNDVLTGENNTAVGYNAGVNVSTGSGNTYIGKSAGLVDVGSNNIYIGEGSGSSVASGNNNVILGSNTGNTISATSNNIIISDGSGNNRIQVDSGGDATFSGNVTAVQGIFKNSGVPAILAYRDLDVTVVGTAGQGIEFGAKSGATFVSGAAIYGTLDNPATNGSLKFQTLTAGTLSNKLTISSGGDVELSKSLTVQNGSDPIVTVSDTDSNYRGSMRWLSSSNVLEFFTRYAGTYYTNNLVLDRGNVGIGTDSPSDKLHVENGSIRLKSNSDGSTGILKLYDAAGSESGQLYPSGGDLRIYSPNDVIFNNGGNVGIGTTTPFGTTTNRTCLSVNGTNDASINMGVGNVQKAYFYTSATETHLSTVGAMPLSLDINGVPKLTISSGGNVGIGVSALSAERLTVDGMTSGTTTFSMLARNSSLTTSFWIRDNGDGYLRANAWIYGSDLRLKENISDVENGIDMVSKMKPKHFDYIDGSKDNLGFIAQDVQKIIPQAVSITDQEKGTLGLKTDFLVPYLVKAIQEQQTIIEDLKSRIETLEG